MIRGLLLMLALFAPTIVLAEDFENPDQVWPTARQTALEDHSWQAPYNTARVALAADRPDLAAALLVIAHQHDVLAEAPVEGLRKLEVPLPTTRQEMLGPFAFSQVLTHLLLFIGALTTSWDLVGWRLLFNLTWLTRCDWTFNPGHRILSGHHPSHPG